MNTILLLAGAGFVLLLTEMFLPGGVLGGIGILALIAATILGYGEFGPYGGTILLAVLAVTTLGGFGVWMAVFPRTAVGRRLTLASVPSGGATLPGPVASVGRDGVAVTPLRPAGTALIDNRRVDVVADGDFIENAAAVVVIASEGSRVVVRRKA